MNQAALELLIQLKDEASAGISNIGGALSNLGGMALAGVAVAGAAIGGFVINGIASAAEAEAAVAQLDAVIKSTGGVAGVTSQELQNLAGAFQKTTKFGEETVIAAQSILLTFTGIGKEIFPDVTAMTLDMAQALGTDAKSAAMQLGKALNDPVAGLSALSRAGVSFSEEQKTMIKTMVEAGDVAGAQGVILAELSKEFGGSAEAAGKTFSGQMEIAKNMLGEFGEMVGGKILPVITPLISRFIDFATAALPQVEAALNQILPLIGDAFAGAMSFIVSALPAVGSTATDVFGIVGTVVTTAVGFITDTLIPAITQVVTFVTANWPAIQATISTVISTLVTTVLPVLVTAFNTIIEVIGFVVAAVITNWPMIQSTIQTVIDVLVTTVLPVLVTAFTGLRDIISQVVAWVVENWPLIQATVTAVITAIQAVITTVLPIIRGIFEAVFPIIKAVVETAMGAVLGIIKTAMQLITGDTKGALETVQDTFSTIWTRIRTALAGVITQIGTIIKNGMANVTADIVRILGESVTFVESLPPKFLQAGRNLIQGLWDGIAGMGGWFQGKFSAWLSSNLPGWARDVLGIGSPSKVAADQIGSPFVQGIIAGIQNESPRLRAALNLMADQMTMAPGASRFSASAGSFAPVASAAGGVVVNIYPGNISSSVDIDDLAYAVAKRVQTARGR